MNKIVKYIPVILLIAVGLFFLFSGFMKMNMYEGFTNTNTEYADAVNSGTAGTQKTVTTRPPSSNPDKALYEGGVSKLGYARGPDGSEWAIIKFDPTSGRPIIGYNGNDPIFGKISTTTPGPTLAPFDPNTGLLSQDIPDNSYTGTTISNTIGTTNSNTSPTTYRPNGYKY
jgi:hypothetical protein